MMFVLFYDLHAAANPPTSVSAALSTPSGSLIITWSPPATGGAEITGYRIYYNLGCLFMNVVVDETVNRYEMGLDGLLPEDIMSVSVRAESAQLPSELITVRIGAGNEALTTTTEELTMTTATAVTTAGMEATRMMTTSGMDGMGTAKMVTTNVNGMGTAPETDSNPVTTVTSDIVSTGPIGIVIDGLQPRTAKDDPLLIVAIVEGVIIAILIIILIVTTVLLLHYR